MINEYHFKNYATLIVIVIIIVFFTAILAVDNKKCQTTDDYYKKVLEAFCKLFLILFKFVFDIILGLFIICAIIYYLFLK
jgi:hypothetical protein